ncbi:hypothetical protein AKO1_004606 [Acrasis kona]|uniref:Uncharacterized protein n=1 Tax=Acrasis kona TaxID=1008807 RepID=A0AAW2Z4S6_9EUKA
MDAHVKKFRNYKPLVESSYKFLTTYVWGKNLKIPQFDMKQLTFYYKHEDGTIRDNTHTVIEDKNVLECATALEKVIPIQAQTQQTLKDKYAQYGVIQHLPDEYYAAYIGQGLTKRWEKAFSTTKKTRKCSDSFYINIVAANLNKDKMISGAFIIATTNNKKLKKTQEKVLINQAMERKDNWFNNIFY